MTKFSACIVTANLRDVDGCDSDAAISEAIQSGDWDDAA